MFLWHRSHRVFALTAAALLVAVHAQALRCDKDAQTNIVYVKFAGCADAEPNLKFDVQIGDEIVTVAKRNANDEYWTGETRRPFIIGQASLTLLANAMPAAARSECGTKATGMKRGPCVALFTVSCETLWILKVEDTSAKTKIRSQRQKATISSCDAPMPAELDGPGEVELTIMETLRVTISKTPGTHRESPPTVEIPFTYGLFGTKTRLKLSDQAIWMKAIVRTTGQAGTTALDEMSRSRVAATYPGMTFIQKVPRKKAEE
jgi:hypothetical protein